MTWPVPRFDYGDTVLVRPLEGVRARVLDLYIFGMARAVEYNVRYFLDGKENKVRVFEDELEAVDGR